MVRFRRQMGDGSTMTELSIGLVIGQLHRGGAEAQLVKLATGLHQRGHRIFVYCLSDVTSPHDVTLRDAGIPLRIVSRKGSGIIPRWLRLRRHFREDALDVAQAFLLGPIVQTALALLGRRRPSFVAANRIMDMKRPLLRRYMETWALGRARIITVNSSPALEYTQDYYGATHGKLRFIPNGVEPLGDHAPSGQEIRKRFNLSPDASVILGIFRLDPQKNLELFCSVVEQVLPRLPGSHCLIAGDGPLRGWLEERARHSPCQSQITLLGPSDEIPALLAAGNILLLTSHFEGMPNVILEAMSAGLPVVATKVGGLVDLIEEGATGYLCPAGDRDKLASACTLLLQDPARAREMGRQASTQCKERFGVEKMVQTYLDLYRDL
ncbi:MAG: glycosyltransferase [Acidobacteria bacterium]|nr:MAG: glycosyltransferase [Acidobacteriota bacterium]